MTNNSEPIEEQTTLDLDNIKTNISQYSSEKLCEMIVCDRYFGMNKQITVICMEELAARRIQGNDFPFETYIEESYGKLPVLNFVMPDLRTTLNQIIKMKK